MNTNKKESAVIFDCDGVMFDSRRANINFYSRLLEKFGLPPMKEEDKAFVHINTAEESVRQIFRGTPYVQQAQAYRMEMDYIPFIKDMLMYPGLKALLKQLKPCFGLAVATNRSNTIGDVLHYHELQVFFDIVVSSLDVQQPKPHPEPIHKILKFFNIPPEKSLYVGDSWIDHKTARAAGVPFVAFKNRTLEADFHVDDLLEIAEILKSSFESGSETCNRKEASLSK